MQKKPQDPPAVICHDMNKIAVFDTNFRGSLDSRTSTLSITIASYDPPYALEVTLYQRDIEALASLFSTLAAMNARAALESSE